MTSQFSPTWQRYFAQAAPPTVLPQRGALCVPPASAVPPEWGCWLVRQLGISQSGNKPPGTAAVQAPYPPSAPSVGAPPIRPRPPVDQRPTPPEPPRRARELAWLTWQMPERLREVVSLNPRQTLDWRTQYYGALDAPKTQAEYTRFGLVGEQLIPIGALTACKKLREELRESVRAVESSQPRLVRNRILAMHSIRLGQLFAELEQRGIDALEELRSGLAWLWDEEALPVGT